MTVDPNTAPLSEEKLDELEALLRWHNAAIEKLAAEDAALVEAKRGMAPRRLAIAREEAIHVAAIEFIRVLARSRPQDDPSKRDEVASAILAEMHTAKTADFPDAPELQSYANGVVDGLSTAALIARSLSRPLEAAPVDGGEAGDLQFQQNTTDPRLTGYIDVLFRGYVIGTVPAYATTMLREVVGRILGAHPAPASPAGTDAKRIAELEHNFGLFAKAVRERMKPGQNPEQADNPLGILGFITQEHERAEAAEAQLAALTDKSGNAELIEAAWDRPIEELARVKAGLFWDVASQVKRSALGSRDRYQDENWRNWREDAVSEIAALRSPAPEGMGWQPIETAPTNRAILLHFKGLDYYGNNGVYAGMLVDMGTGKRWITFGWACGRDVGDAPDAWCPMPSVASFNKEEGE